MKLSLAKLAFLLLIAVGLILVVSVLFGPPRKIGDQTGEMKPRLFWFIPDGFRADPELFDIYKWARAGKLPNVRALMERGTYGFCRPTFPGHTPTNFATLFTGAYPEVHGVNDGPMHTEGNPLSVVSVGGFNSAAKLVEPIWVTLERKSEADVILLSVPGSTPPELDRGMTIKAVGEGGEWISME